MEFAGYNLQFEIERTPSSFSWEYIYESKCIVLDSEFVIPPSGSLHITSKYRFSNTVLGIVIHKIAQGRKENDPVSFQYSHTLAGKEPRHVFQVIRTECLT